MLDRSSGRVYKDDWKGFFPKWRIWRKVGWMIGFEMIGWFRFLDDLADGWLKRIPMVEDGKGWCWIDRVEGCMYKDERKGFLFLNDGFGERYDGWLDLKWSDDFDYWSKCDIGSIQSKHAQEERKYWLMF